MTKWVIITLFVSDPKKRDIYKESVIKKDKKEKETDGKKIGRLGNT